MTETKKNACFFIPPWKSSLRSLQASLDARSNKVQITYIELITIFECRSFFVPLAGRHVRLRQTFISRVLSQKREDQGPPRLSRGQFARSADDWRNFIYYSQVHVSARPIDVTVALLRDRWESSRDAEAGTTRIRSDCEQANLDRAPPAYRNALFNSSSITSPRVVSSGEIRSRRGLSSVIAAMLRLSGHFDESLHSARLRDSPRIWSHHRAPWTIMQ